jgi:hypothetical protein
MPLVAVYKFRANFRAVDPLGPDRSLEGLLLLRQETDARDDAAAVAACTAFDAFDAVIERYAPVDVTTLARPRNADFAQMHARALSEGRALVYYDDAAPAAPVAQGSPSQ